MSPLERRTEIPEAVMERRGVSIDMVRRQRSSGAAVSFACQISGLEDKEIYLELEIDAGTFSRIKKGEANLPADKLAEFCRVVGNTAYPEWLAYQLGCTLVMIKSEAERRADEFEARAKRAEDKLELMKELYAGIGRAA